MTPLTEIFREEAGELLAQLESSLLVLEGDSGSSAAIGQVFRVAHTLKGSAAMSGFAEISAMAHDLESAFDLVRSGSLKVSPELISLTFWALDFIRAALSGTGEEDGGGRQRIHALVSTLLQISGVSRPPAPAQSEVAVAHAVAAADDERLYLVRFRPGAETLRRGIHPVQLFSALGDLGRYLVLGNTDALPALAVLDPECCYLRWDLLVATSADEPALRDLFIFVEDDCELGIHLLRVGTGLPFELEEYRDFLTEQRGAPLSEVCTAFGHQLSLPATSPPADVPQPVEPTPVRPSAEVDSRHESGSRDEQFAYLRVRTDTLDSLVSLIGELVTLEGRLSASAGRLLDEGLSGISEEAERLTIALRRQVLRARMLPIGTTFGRFRRQVRDLSQELGKEIELLIEGDKTELDKTMLDQLQDSLGHLVRNCVDHGIESPALRRERGKPERGVIRLTAAQKGAHIVIEVGDDGGGLDLEQVRRKAEAMGLLDARTEADDRVVADLIFHPGLSTAAAVTSVSGRGVGMDAVRDAVQALRGTIEVATRPGLGTTFTLKLPLTLAIVDGLLVQVGKGRYVLPLADVRECIDLNRARIEQSRQRELLLVRGEVVPYLRLREFFGIHGAPPAGEQVVIVQLRGERLGLAVDRVIGGHQVVSKGLGKVCGDTPGLSGATILGDGGIALTIDLARLFTAAQETLEDPAVA